MMHVRMRALWAQLELVLTAWASHGRHLTCWQQARRRRARRQRGQTRAPPLAELFRRWQEKAGAAA
eukprot:3765303-Pyramimonas_sp.AAC.1